MSRHRTLVLAGVLVAALAGCSAGSGAPGRPGSAAPPTERARADAGEEFVPFDVRPLLSPKRKYLGVAIEGALRSPAVLAGYTEKIGKRPNLIAYYAAWGDEFDASGVRAARTAGALPMMSWEPFEPSLTAIADGASDEYVRRFARAVRAMNIPVAISLGHEMNGYWYPWGTRTTSPADFVRAWRHVHDLFLEVGATAVIWVWNPNVVNPVPGVPLRPLYPGDSYVDWIGLTGYYTGSGARTFTDLFGPTLRSLRAFTRKPVLIAETGAEQGPRKAAHVADLFRGVSASPDVVGLVWFEYRKRTDWRVSTAPSALAEYRRRAADPRFGFDVRDP